MASAAVPDLPLKDLNNWHGTVSLNKEVGQMDDFVEDSDGSSEFDVDDSVSMIADPQQMKNRAQREIFERYLDATKSKPPVETGAIDCEDGKDGPMQPKKIIDEVRRYQQELFEKALDENVIAVLDTGSGKTLIACLLIRHVLTEEVVRRGQGKPPRIVFFLANSVHLVYQQARVLQTNLATSPVVFVGDDNNERWKTTEIWPNLIANSIPVVCTPAVLQQCLDAALVKIEQISLLVFDEAHHAKKSHPYSRIIRSHYLQCDSELRPKIFGMTASPVDSKSNVDVSIADLEELLHCKIVTAHDPSMLSFAPKPKDVVWRYGRRMPQFETQLCATLSAKFGFWKGNWEIKKAFIFARASNSELGSWCSNRVWRYVIGESEHEAIHLINQFEKDREYLALESIEQRQTALQDVKEAITYGFEYSLGPPIAELSDLSPKVLRLYEELLATYRARPGTRAIIFVDQRFTALVLRDCFQELKLSNVRPAVLLGTARDSSSLKKQETFLDQFRAGSINLIFATSVADEGIDIPQCNLCVRFDLYKSPIQYIQSRGRARMGNSIYAHMIEEGNAGHEKDLRYAINSDKYIHEYCQKLKPDRLLGHGTKLERMIALDSRNKSFKTTTGAICDFGNSLLVLSRFTSSLYYRGAIEKEIYEEEIDEVNCLFRYTVRLPTISEIPIAGARGEWKPNKQLARRSAAWNCCFLLRRHGLLDDALDSHFKKVKPENLNARLAISEKKAAWPMLLKPSAWEQGIGTVPTKLYMSVIHFKPRRSLQCAYVPIIFLTRLPQPSLPMFTVYIEDNVETEVSIITQCQSWSVTAAEVDLLTTFTLCGVFRDVFNKTYEIDSSRMSYWLAPMAKCLSHDALRPTDLIDTGALEAAKHDRISWSSDCKADGMWTNKFLCDPRNGNFRYITYNIVPDASVFDPVPSTVPHLPQKSRDSIIDFSDSSWKASKKFIRPQYDPGQPVISADLLTARRNFLEPNTNEKVRARVRCLIAPQPLEVSRIDPAFANSCFVWPSIIHRLESYMIALEAFHKLGLYDVPADLALEALTKDNDDDDHELQTHTGGRHGMGRNYERLEFIGDSLLKMMTTITVFNRTKCDEEGMHCRRMEILCNRRLYDVSTEKHHLYRYARTTGFNRTTWYPENLILVKGRGAKKVPEPAKHKETNQDLGMKTIADISEAIIGAAVVSSRGSKCCFDRGIQAITKLVDSEDHAINSWSEIANMYAPPEWSLALNDIQANKLAEDIAVKTGYHFKHPRLLRSAFTHSSDINAPVPDLQRLEFLGDAVLDWVSISWLFHSNPDRNPQWLTEHKMAMVSNKFLAALAVHLDFDKFLYCTTTKLFAGITSYAKRVRDAYADANASRNVWTHIDSPPKALSDLVEAYLGAVLVDSGFDYSVVEKFFLDHVQWFFKDISQYDSFANRHPTTFLYKKITDDFKCRGFSVIASNTDEGLVEARVTAGVLIHNQVIADSSGTSAKYAKVRASQRALARLEGMKIEDFRKTFGCNCRSKEE